jgi:hypothetical protein
MRGEGGGGGDGHHQFKTAKINNKQATETDVVYVYTKANIDNHSYKRKKNLNERFCRLTE